MQKIFHYFKVFFDLVSCGQRIIVLIIIMALQNGCDRPGDPKSIQPVDKAILGVGSGLFVSPVWIAIDKGYFIEQGLDLSVKKFSTGKASLAAMLEGAVDFSTAALTPIIYNSFARQDFSIIATFSSSNTNIKVIARKDSGINIAKDLKGKKIGVPAGTSAQFFLTAFLIYNGIEESEIAEVDIRPPDLLAAIDNAQVDAIITWEPFGYKARQLLQQNAVTLSISKIVIETFNLTVMNDYAKNNPEVLKKILRALAQASIFIRTHKEESIDIIAKNIKLEKVLIGKLWDDYNFDIGLDQTLLLSLEDEARWMIRKKLTDSSTLPNYLNYISAAALEEVKPEAVTIIR